MELKPGTKNSKQHIILYTIVTMVLLCVVFLGMVYSLYNQAENEAYENLHVQTKQIKDDIILQLTSDRENLVTIANFAANLYRDGKSYDRIFESFKSIGLIDRIGILNPDNTLVIKSGVVDMQGSISFEQEKTKGIYISGKTEDIIKEDYQLIRSVVPIIVDGETVGILYGVIKPDKFGDRYKNIVNELEAQLFVYDQASGDILIDTIQDQSGNISFLKDRKYHEGSSYEQLISTDKGFVSFQSAFRDENLHLHYSAIDEFGWIIAMGRYDSQVFANTHTMANLLFLVFLIMIGIMALYVFILMVNERNLNVVTECASNVRKELLETTDGQNNIQDALREVCKLAKSSFAVFFDTNGEFYHYIAPQYKNIMFSTKDELYFKSELFRYASEFHNRNNKEINMMCIKPNRYMQKRNALYYSFLKEHHIKEISFSATITKFNHITILATINSKRGNRARRLAEKVSACFSMALYNKNYLNKTILSATTDSLTGVLNRVAFKSDLSIFDGEQAVNSLCIYIDVNELHLINNKYGHAAGDEMLLYVANTLKEAFLGHKVYRMGGDEFLVFCQNVPQDAIKKKIEFLCEQLKTRNYHIAIGTSYRAQNADIEEMVREAEVRMYETKAQYYQQKEQQNTLLATDEKYLQVKTGILEIDTMISVLKEKYNGIYRVSLFTDKARRILMPAYLNYNENEDHFSNLFSKYVAESVAPDYHRAVLSFLNYDALKHQLMEGKIPKITYKKNNGELVILSVYPLCEEDELVADTLWVFAKA